MRRKLITSISLVFGGLILAASVIVFAWYINQEQTKSVDYITDGLVLQYEIDESGLYNQEEFEIKDVVFFDIDAENEGKYFNTMAKVITLDITNYSHAYVDLNVKQNIQPYTLSATISNNTTITVYEYTKATVTRDATFSTDDALAYYSYADTTGYTKATAYTSGTTYFTRSVLGVSTVTIQNNKLKTVVSTDGAEDDPVSYVSEIDADGLSFNVGTYQLAPTGLTKAAFNVGKYYTENNGVYTLAKNYVAGTQYYEVNTLYYVGDITLSGSTVSAIGTVTTGAYVTCAITNTALPTITTSASVETYLSNNSVSNDYTHATRLNPATGVNDGTAATKGGSVSLYVYIYGVQPFDNASNNFLNNATNDYPFSIIISANQSANQSAS